MSVSDDDDQPRYDDIQPDAGPQQVRLNTGKLPSCPGCGTHNDPSVHHVHHPIERLPTSHGLAAAAPYSCGNCRTVFAGTDDEWNRMRRTRDEYHRLHTANG